MRKKYFGFSRLMDKSDFNKLMGVTIQRTRSERGLTQSEIAARMNIDPQNLSKYERGEISPTVYWVKHFCLAVDVDLLEFIGDFEQLYHEKKQA